MNGWERRRLGDVLSIQNGFAFDSKSFDSMVGTPLIRIRDLKRGRGTETRFIGDYDRRYLVADGDLLIGMDGDFGCYEWRGGPALLNQRVCRLRDFSEALLPRFLFYGVNSYLKAIEDVTGYTTVKHLSSKQILSIEFPTPPISEQQRIVALLDEVFGGIASAATCTETNLRNARTVFESQLDRVLAAPSDEWSLGIPLSALLSVQPRNGWSPPKEYQTDTGVPVLTLSSVTGFEYDGSKVKLTSAPTVEGAHYWLQPGEILVTRSNTPALVGHVAMYDGVPAHAICCDLIMKMTVDSEKALTRFIYYYMRSSTGRSYLTERATGANPTMVKIGKGVVQDMPVPLPSLRIQRNLVDLLDRTLVETRRLESVYRRKLSALDALNRSLLNAAFSGSL